MLKHVFICVLPVLLLLFAACDDGSSPSVDGDVDSQTDADVEALEEFPEADAEDDLAVCDGLQFPSSFGSCLVPEGGWGDDLNGGYGNPPRIHVTGEITQKDTAPLHEDCDYVRGVSISIDNNTPAEAPRIRVQDGDMKLWDFFFSSIPFDIPLEIGDQVTIDCLVKIKWTNAYGACRIERDDELIFFIVNGMLEPAEWAEFPLGDLSLTTGEAVCHVPDTGIDHRQLPIHVTSGTQCLSINPGEVAFFPDSGLAVSGFWYELRVDPGTLTDYGAPYAYDYFIVRNDAIDPDQSISGYSFSATACD